MRTSAGLVRPRPPSPDAARVAGAGSTRRVSGYANVGRGRCTDRAGQSADSCRGNKPASPRNPRRLAEGVAGFSTAGVRYRPPNPAPRGPGRAGTRRPVAARCSIQPRRRRPPPRTGFPSELGSTAALHFPKAELVRTRGVRRCCFWLFDHLAGNRSDRERVGASRSTRRSDPHLISIHRGSIVCAHGRFRTRTGRRRFKRSQAPPNSVSGPLASRFPVDNDSNVACGASSPLCTSKWRRDKLGTSSESGRAADRRCRATDGHYLGSLEGTGQSKRHSSGRVRGLSH